MNDNSPDDSHSKVFLRRRDGMIYAQDGAWTSDANLARIFEAASPALAFGRTLGVEGLQIVVRTGSEENVIPIDS